MYSVLMQDNLDQIAEKELHLVGAKKARFVREARALRSNLELRQKQKKERESKCIRSK